MKKVVWSAKEHSGMFILQGNVLNNWQNFTAIKDREDARYASRHCEYGGTLRGQEIKNFRVIDPRGVEVELVF